MTIKLYDYWRSSAAYRVRIALHLKGLAYEAISINLVEGAQKDEAYRAVNPHGLVPALAIDGVLLTQSLAIIQYLDIARPGPALLPAGPRERARAMARALTIAADIHPIQNLRVMHRLRDIFGADQDAQFAWNRHWIESGFAALEVEANEPFLSGAEPGIADICLVPQMANARRFKVDLSPFPKLAAIDAKCLAIEAFSKASPENNKPPA